MKPNGDVMMTKPYATLDDWLLSPIWMTLWIKDQDLYRILVVW